MCRAASGPSPGQLGALLLALQRGAGKGQRWGRWEQSRRGQLGEGRGDSAASKSGKRGWGEGPRKAAGAARPAVISGGKASAPLGGQGYAGLSAHLTVLQSLNPLIDPCAQPWGGPGSSFSS